MSHPNPNQDPMEPMLPDDFICNEIDDPIEGLDDGRQREDDESLRQEIESRQREDALDVLETARKLREDPEWQKEYDEFLRSYYG